MMPALFSFYVRHSRARAWKIWHAPSVRHRHSLMLQKWWHRQLHTPELLSCPVRPGDEIFVFEGRNIVEHVLSASRLDVLEQLVEKGLSGMFKPLEIFFTKDEFVMGHPVITLSQTPGPLMQCVLGNQAQALRILLKDKNPSLWEENPNLPVYQSALVAGSVDAFEALIENKVDLVHSHGLLCVQPRAWRQSLQLELKGEHLLRMVCRLVDDHLMGDFFKVLDRHISIKEELKIDATLGNGCFLKSILHGKRHAVQLLLERGASPNPVLPWSGINEFPLFLATLQNNPDVVCCLLDYGACWNVGGFDVGRAVLAKASYLRQYGQTLPLGMTVAKNIYEALLESRSTKAVLGQVLEEKISRMPDGGSKKM